MTAILPERCEDRQQFCSRADREAGLEVFRKVANVTSISGTS
jgi:hypothetical protein